MKKSLKNFRNQIDDIDNLLIDLLVKRQNLAAEVAHLKKLSGGGIFDPQREKEILKRIKILAQGKGLDQKLASEIITKIMVASKTRQKKAQVILDKITPKNFKLRKKKLKVTGEAFVMFRKIYAEFSECFFLESLGVDPHFARQSFIGFAPKTKILARGSELTVGGERFPTQNPYFELEKFLPKVSASNFPWPFIGGLVGYLTYEATKYFEEAVQFPTHPDFPDFEFGLFLDGIVIDKKTGVINYFYLDEDRSAMIEKVLNKKLSAFKKFKALKKGVSMTRKSFEKKVKMAKQEIVAGKIFQAQVGRKYFFELAGDRMKFYDRLRKLNPSPQMFYVKFNQRELIGSSPELTLRVENGVVENFPLAGTRQRGKNKKEDREISRELLADEKEKAEHIMLVDLGRNDVGRVCDFHTVAPRKIMEVKNFPRVMHLGSEIVGKLRAGMTAFNALATNTPVGTVSGAPKVEAMKIIQRLEDNQPRGPYAGAIGYFSLSGDANFAAGLRSLFANGKKAYVQASAGIVYDSAPRYEFAEVEKKAGSIIRAVEEASRN